MPQKNVSPQTPPPLPPVVPYQEALEKRSGVPYVAIGSYVIAMIALLAACGAWKQVNHFPTTGPSSGEVFESAERYALYGMGVSAAGVICGILGFFIPFRPRSITVAVGAILLNVLVFGIAAFGGLIAFGAGVSNGN